MSSVIAPNERMIYLGRQAIFDRRTRVNAYELLYRDGTGSSANFDNDHDATQTTVLTALTEFGLETVSNGKDIFVNFSKDTLRSEFSELLPREKTVIEVLETVEPDDPTLVALDQLKSEGCRIALDDFVFDPRFEPLLELADIVKVDLRVTATDDLPKQLDLMRNYGVRLLAEKVETQEEMEYCKQLGFELFQGWFFCRPQVIAGKSLAPDRAGTLHLVSELQNDDLPLQKAATLISQDPALSIKLLKYINSAHCGLSRKVESIKHAAALVGRNRLRMWATLLGLGGLSNKPRELLVAANVRGRMCDVIGSEVYNDRSGAYFTVGMFSLLDAMLDIPLEELVNPLPLSDAVIEALLEGTGPLGFVLDVVKRWEVDNLDLDVLAGTRLTPTVIRHAYKDALIWTSETLSNFGV